MAKKKKQTNQEIIQEILAGDTQNTPVETAEQPVEESMEKSEAQQKADSLEVDFNIDIDAANAVYLKISRMAKRILTNFKKRKNDGPSKSQYYAFRTFIIRVSDHLAKTSNGSVQIVPLNGQILFWKVGVPAPHDDLAGSIEGGYMLKIVTEEELEKVLTLMNVSAKYFVP